jgi:hypothetical protein
MRVYKNVYVSTFKYYEYSGHTKIVLLDFKVALKLYHLLGHYRRSICLYYA